MENDVLNKISELEANKDIAGLEEIKMTAEAGFEGDIAGAAEQAITRLTGKAMEVAATSPTQEKQVEDLGGSKGEIERRTETIDTQIKTVETDAAKKIEEVKNQSTEGEKKTGFEAYFDIWSAHSEGRNVPQYTQQEKNTIATDTVKELLAYKDNDLANTSTYLARFKELGMEPDPTLVKEIIYKNATKELERSDKYDTGSPTERDAKMSQQMAQYLGTDPNINWREELKKQEAEKETTKNESANLTPEQIEYNNLKLAYEEKMDAYREFYKQIDETRAAIEKIKEEKGYTRDLKKLGGDLNTNQIKIDVALFRDKQTGLRNLDKLKSAIPADYNEVFRQSLDEGIGRFSNLSDKDIQYMNDTYQPFRLGKNLPFATRKWGEITGDAQVQTAENNYQNTAKNLETLRQKVETDPELVAKNTTLENLLKEAEAPALELSQMEKKLKEVERALASKSQS